ncbi:hypothetical protein ACFWN7_01930 [Agromyces sp. NPDC058484]|uniref:hypothetical protein n=1 Tax=Agromyces sp. NPDC058484 TaxID=3346524 RepID=UPI00365BC835
MSIEAVKWWKATEKFDAEGRQLYTPGEAAVLLYLADMTNESTHYAFASLRRTSRELGIYRRSIERIMSDLEDRDVIRTQRAYEPMSGSRMTSHSYLPLGPKSHPWRWWDERVKDANGEVPMMSVILKGQQTWVPDVETL